MSFAPPVTSAGQPSHAVAWRRWTPSLVDVFFCALLVGIALGPGGWQALLADGDTGWHIRTGEIVLATGAAPSADPFSFTRAGEPWFAWEWLAGGVVGGAWRWGGGGGGGGNGGGGGGLSGGVVGGG